ncbi:MAG: adenylyl-sulfate kinase [Saprospiraceae bacterium]|nr:adenylyl-sulfate kinase [Saprospiraceae bacterium]
MNNIHPIYDRIMSRAEREAYLHQRGMVLWFTGLSGSGKSTIAIALEKKLFNHKYFAQVLDGDNIRHGINSNLGFSLEDRQENIRRIAEVAKLYKDSGIITLCSFISPTQAMRNMARGIVGQEDFLEIFIDTPLEVCEQRDVKGLYKKARAGEIKEFTGIDSIYEEPSDPVLHIQTENRSVMDTSDEVLGFVLGQMGERSKTGKTFGENYSDLEDKLTILEEDHETYQRFEDLKVWKESMRLATIIHNRVKDIDIYSLRDQILRSAISVPSNIAEGYERRSNKEKIRFYYIAKGSCGELRTQLMLLQKFRSSKEDWLNDAIKQCYGISALIAKLIQARSRFE